MVVTAKSAHYDFYKREVDRAIKDCDMWNDKVRLITYTTIITETCDGRPFGWLNYTNPREPQFKNFKPNDGDPPDKSWSTQRSGGLFQQQPQFWGPDVMDPYKATTSFLIGFRFADGRSAAGLVKTDYIRLPVHTACQIVQGSEFAAGDNYKRNIPYAQMVLDSGENSMASYEDPDGFMDGSQVTYGIDDPGDPNSRKESIRHNLWATNSGVYAGLGILQKISLVRSTITNTDFALQDMISFIDGHVAKNIPEHIGNAANNVISHLGNLIRQVPAGVADELINRRWPWWNQEGVPVEAQGTNSFVENLFATNGRVYHPLWGNKALSDKLDLVVQLLQASQPNNPAIAKLIQQYNDAYPSDVPVVISTPQGTES